MKEKIQIKQIVKVANPVDPQRVDEIELIVDTGATFSIIKKEILEKIGIKSLGSRKLKLANGQFIERLWGVALFIIEGKSSGGSDVVFGEEGDIQLLGLLALEGMALSINTKTGELEPIETFLL
jgi:predicted aspartyl protease